MPTIASTISDASNAADIEMTAFLQGLGDAERGTYIGNNIQTVIDKVGAAKNDRFQYLSEDMTGTDNNITSTAYYVQRTGDLKSMAEDIDSVAAKQVSASSINSSLINRQEEINEWSNNNKLDTLFFLQILFITLTFISTMVFLNSNGYISSYFLNLWIILSSFFAVFILITRARKTSVLRDGRYWSKMRFGAQKAPANTGATCPGAAAQPTLLPNPPVAPTCNSNVSLLGDLPLSIPVGWGGRPPAPTAV